MTTFATSNILTIKYLTIKDHTQHCRVIKMKMIGSVPLLGQLGNFLWGTLAELRARRRHHTINQIKIQKYTNKIHKYYKFFGWEIHFKSVWNQPNKRRGRVPLSSVWSWFLISSFYGICICISICIFSLYDKNWLERTSDQLICRILLLNLYF